jgi:hypothetical protein
LEESLVDTICNVTNFMCNVTDSGVFWSFAQWFKTRNSWPKMIFRKMVNIYPKVLLGLLYTWEKQRNANSIMITGLILYTFAVNHSAQLLWLLESPSNGCHGKCLYVIERTL